MHVVQGSYSLRLIMRRSSARTQLSRYRSMLAQYQAQIILNYVHDLSYN